MAPVSSGSDKVVQNKGILIYFILPRLLNFASRLVRVRPGVGCWVAKNWLEGLCVLMHVRFEWC